MEGAFCQPNGDPTNFLKPCLIATLVVEPATGRDFRIIFWSLLEDDTRHRDGRSGNDGEHADHRPWVGIGLLVGSFAMAGDLVSSFCKRRLGLPSSGRASGPDPIPESPLPLLACRDLLALRSADILVCVVMFVIGEVVLSRLLYAFRLRDRPY
jgi:hypothetical protein